MIKFIIFFYFISANLLGLENNQTEITTDEGIEVFQNEKFYLLKGNVKIKSNQFILNADIVKAFFNNDLYDIQKIECEGSVYFKSNNGAEAKGNKLNYDTIKKTIKVFGINSSIANSELILKSNESIYIDNITGKFNLIGKLSELETKELKVIGEKIEGNYQNNNGINEIINLKVYDNEQANIISDKINMFSKKAIYEKKNNFIELFNNVKIIRNKDVIIGDYAKINTLDNSYKITSDNESKVKIILNNSDE